MLKGLHLTLPLLTIFAWSDIDNSAEAVLLTNLMCTDVFHPKWASDKYQRWTHHYAVPAPFITVIYRMWQGQGGIFWLILLLGCYALEFPKKSEKGN